MNVFLIVKCIVLFTAVVNTEQVTTYRAAVLEYAPITDAETPKDNWDLNLKEFLHYIQDAVKQKAQIIVLPEVGLSGWNIESKDIDALSTEIPDPNLYVIPCTTFNANNFSSTLRDLSCAAQTNRIYVVVNIIEKEVRPNNKKPVYHNTNVVFNRNGELIVRFRKINLFNEPDMEPGNELATFTTDFGVTFGVFICFDIIFKMPSVEILLNNNVTDIAYSTAWFSHLPFYESLSVQHGFAKTNGINLLASGLNDPSSSLGGSGIYLGDGTIAETFISGSPLSKLIVQDVPKISSKIPNSSCKVQKTSGTYEWGVDPVTGNISNFYTFTEDMSNYTFKALNLLGKTDIVETVCGGFGTFCCTFNISTSRTHNIEPTYTYMLVAFQGATNVSSSGTRGLRNCGIVACLDANPESCGKRKTVPPKGITFEKISIKASLDTKEVRYQPATLTFDLKPATDYTYCAVKNGDKVDLSMESSDSHDTLLTFAITGRVFSYDQLPSGSIRNSTVVYRSTVILVLVGIVSVLFCTFRFI